MARVRRISEIPVATPIPALAPIERPLFCLEVETTGEASIAVTDAGTVVVPVGGRLFVVRELKSKPGWEDDALEINTIEGVIVVRELVEVGEKWKLEMEGIDAVRVMIAGEIVACIEDLD